MMGFLLIFLRVCIDGLLEQDREEESQPQCR